jgi:molybdopterin/thiamine biosynthesis adenylyltransferase
MDKETMKTPISLTLTDRQYKKIQKHLFPGDNDEHGLVIAAGIVETPRGTRLLARDTFMAKDGKDYVPGKHGYRALTAEFVAEKSSFCCDQNLCYLAVHCHGGNDWVAFSTDDLASHERGYPALLDITKGGPVGALVFAKNAVAGDIWTRDGRYELDSVTVIGSRIQKIFPRVLAGAQFSDLKYDRNVRLIGENGQEILSKLKIGIVGLGGGGSILNELVSRLGVGHIVAVDFDRVDLTNLPRIVGATEHDAIAFLTRTKNPWLKYLGKRFAKYKVHIAQKVAKQANPKIRYEAIVGNIVDKSIAHQLVDVDFLFLATDSIQSRLVFNAIVYQYLIPGAQIGVKVLVNTERQVDQILVASRMVMPFSGGGCLSCNNLIPAGRLANEGLSEKERRAQRYIDDDEISEPNVISLNAMSAARVVNDFMMMFTGLFNEVVNLNHLIEFAENRELCSVKHQIDKVCLDCSNSGLSRLGRGDRAHLPCRENS